jgi:hypothetical protein
MEFGYDGKHGAYQLPPPPPVVATVGTSVVAPTSPPTRSSSPPAASRPTPSAAPKVCRAATHWGKKQNILVKGLKTLISMCCSNDALICESHQ